MAEKINLDTLSTDLRTVIKPDNGHTFPQATDLWNDASLSRIRAHEHVQPSVSDLRMVVRIQRKNKHPHSTKNINEMNQLKNWKEYHHDRKIAS